MTTKVELLDLLWDEFNRHRSPISVWDCPEPDCPYYGKPCSKDCDCHMMAQREHIAAVKRELAK